MEILNRKLIYNLYLTQNPNPNHHNNKIIQNNYLHSNLN